MNPAIIHQLGELLVECFNNQRHHAALATRAQYIGELLAATLRGDDTEAEPEARDWLARLEELCSEHADDARIAPWFDREQTRLRKLIHP
jgi:hypothetical protein